mmetsp:Transcript_12036/g.19049  ORF Transcript_12036/g.19049 Transcript_12036/m.19049 type:complete len:97 (+) Transcript_12036:140-430(+)
MTHCGKSPGDTESLLILTVPYYCVAVAGMCLFCRGAAQGPYFRYASLAKQPFFTGDLEPTKCSHSIYTSVLAMPVFTLLIFMTVYLSTVELCSNHY